MKLRDNPVYGYAVRTYWRGWKLWFLPTLTLVILLTTFLLLMRYDDDMARGLIGVMVQARMRLHSPITLVWALYVFVFGGGAKATMYFLIPGLIPPLMAREFEFRTFEPLRVT